MDSRIASSRSTSHRSYSTTRRHGVGHRGLVAGAGVAPVEVLDLLDRVRRLADPETLAHHGVQVDEPLAAQQLVELGLARAVSAGQPCERGPLVGRVVVDVHARVGFPAAHQLVEQVLGELLLPLGVVRPEPGEGAVAVPQAREVLPAAAVVGPGVALEVEVDVAGTGLGQPLQAPALLGRQQRVGRLGHSRARPPGDRPAGAGGCRWPWTARPSPAPAVRRPARPSW